MNEMQLGLAMAAPTILAFIAFVYRTGAIPPAGAIAAASTTLVIAAVLFIAQ